MRSKRHTTGEERRMHMIGAILLAICTALGIIIPLFG